METDDDIPELMIITRDDDFIFDTEKEYYLAGPMTGYPGYNYGEFSNACRILRFNGVKVKSPHEIDHGELEEAPGALPYDTYIENGLTLLRQCGGIIMLPGFLSSKGAMTELNMASELNMPGYFFHEPIEWRDEAELVCLNRKPRT